MLSTLRPETTEQVREAVAWAIAAEQPLEVVASGSKRAIGRAMQTAATLDLSKLSGITLYEPDELVLSARAATPRAEAEQALAAHRQAFAFEPPDLSRLLGAASAGTLGGMVAANLAGPRRIKAGAVRDHFLGFSAVSGRGEAFKAGGRVVKNVTGYDLPKVLAGSWGTLAVLCDITLKVLPSAETETSVLLRRLDDPSAMRAMSAAVQSACDVSGAAHLPAVLAKASAVAGIGAADQSVTALRLEGIAPSVDYRAARLIDLLAEFGAGERLDEAASREFWVEVRDVHALANGGDRLVWRLSVPPMEGARVLAQVHELIGARGYYDWAGGLIWLDAPAAPHGHAESIRSAILPATGHATLVRAPADIRAAVAPFEPLSAPLTALTRRLKDGFDPKRILNPGRMYVDL